MNFEQLEYESNESERRGLEDNNGHRPSKRYNDIRERLSIAIITVIILYLLISTISCAYIGETAYKASSANRLYITVASEEVQANSIGEYRKHMLVETYEGLLELLERLTEQGYNCTHISERAAYYRNVLGKRDIVVVLISN